MVSGFFKWEIVKVQKEKNDDDEGAEGRQKSKGREERNEDKNQIFLKTKTIAIAKSYSMPNTVAFLHFML